MSSMSKSLPEGRFSAESAWFILGVGGRVGKLVAMSHAT
jgi:hypothetical protein